MSSFDASLTHAPRSPCRVAVVTLLIGACCVVAPPGVIAQQVPAKLVGFTSNAATGSVGLAHLHGLCQSEFAETRMCTTEEIVASVDPPLTTERAYAWAHTTTVATSDYANSLFDATGKLLSLDQGVAPNCDGWS